MQNEIDLSGVRALVTGGTSGLGRAMAEALTAAGARVVLTGRTAERAEAAAATMRGAIDRGADGLRAGEPAAVGIGCDTRDEADVARLVDRSWALLGGLDLVVNNAGLGMRTVNPAFLTTPQGFWDVPVEGFRAVVETNLTGYFLVAREVAPRMLEAGSGRIVNISMNHRTMNRRGFVPYGPSRAAAEALSRIMAADLADTPVRVNMLLPGGATATGMMPDDAPPHDTLAPEVMGPPIVWLASPAAADVHDERIVARDFDSWLAARTA